MNEKETLALVARMSAAWPAMEIPDNTVDVWTEQLAELDPDDALAAAHSLIRSSKWFPTISEFLEAARSVMRWRLENAKPLALESGEHLSREERRANVARLVAETKRVVDANRARSRRLRPQT